jgi:hypothetical protein
MSIAASSAPGRSCRPMSSAPRCCSTSPGPRGCEKFLQIGTDEVYGTLPEDRPDLKFTEETPLAPNSPYSASKAAADCLVRVLFSYVQSPRAHHPLFQQLRPLPFSRKAHPPVRHQPHGREESAPLRRRHERARLALRRGPLPGDLDGAEQGKIRRGLQHRRQQRDHQPQNHRDDPPRDGQGLGPIGAIREGSSRPRPALRHRRRQNPARVGLVAETSLRGGHPHHDPPGTRTIRTGGAPSRAANI